jgi:predicted RNA binding protein YcfA (HicA-like mRNA interferase family)
MRNAEKLLERMRRTKDGWRPQDFRRLYTGFGFEVEEGGSHTTYKYSKYRILTQIPRHPSLASVYASIAVKLIDDILAREEEERLEKERQEKEREKANG